MRVVDVSYNMKQQLLDFLQHDVEVGGELIAMLGWEDSLIVDDLLHVGHNVVHVLWGGKFALLPLVIKPHVSTWPGAHHLRAGGQVTELRHRPVQKVYVLEEPDGCNERSMSGCSFLFGTYCAERATRWHPDQTVPQ